MQIVPFKTVGDLQVIVHAGLVLDGLPFLSSSPRIASFEVEVQIVRYFGLHPNSQISRRKAPRLRWNASLMCRSVYRSEIAWQRSGLERCTRHPFLGNLVTCELISFLGMDDEKISVLFPLPLNLRYGVQGLDFRVLFWFFATSFSRRACR